MPNRRMSVARVGVEPTGREGLSFAALPVCVPRYLRLIKKASPIGFEPTISTVTGWRALLAALRGPVSVAQVGVEPTAALVLSQGGLPVAYRAVCAPSRSRTCKHSGLSRAALPIGVSGRVVPDGIEPPLPG